MLVSLWKEVCSHWLNELPVGFWNDSVRKKKKKNQFILISHTVRMHHLV